MIISLAKITFTQSHLRRIISFNTRNDILLVWKSLTVDFKNNVIHFYSDLTCKQWNKATLQWNLKDVYTKTIYNLIMTKKWKNLWWLGDQDIQTRWSKWLVNTWKILLIIQVQGVSSPNLGHRFEYNIIAIQTTYFSTSCW